MRVKSITILFTLFAFLFSVNLLGQDIKKKPPTSAELQKELDQLNVNYWKEKEKRLKKRAELSDDMTLLEDETRSLYEKKNSITEDIYMKKEFLKNLEDSYDEQKAKALTLNAQLSEYVKNEKEKAKSGVPSLIERRVILLNELLPKEENLDVSVTQNKFLFEKVVQYKKFLIEQGESAVVSRNNILTKEGIIEADTLRLGYVWSGYREGDKSGLLVRASGLSGISYDWIHDLSGDNASAVRLCVDEAFSHSKTGNTLLSVPIDPVQAGKKMSAFSQSTRTGVFQWFANLMRDGGALMYPIMALALFALVLILERVLYFRKNRGDIDSLMDEIFEALKFKDNAKAIKLCNDNPGPITRTIAPLLTNLEHNRQTAEQILEEMLSQEIPLLEKRLATLAVLGAIAPLLGLLGTVNGMIELFDVITLYGTNNPKILAGGISIALITTQAGLAIAIPVMFSHHLLVKTKNNILSEMEKKSFRLLNGFFPENK